MIKLAGTWTVTDADDDVAGSGTTASGSVFENDTIWVAVDGSSVPISGPYKALEDASADDAIKVDPPFNAALGVAAGAGRVLWVQRTGGSPSNIALLQITLFNQRYAEILNVAGASKQITLNKTASGDNAGLVFQAANANLGRVGAFADNLIALQQDINNGSMTSLIKAVVTGTSPSQTLGITLAPITVQSATAFVVGRLVATPALKINTNTGSSITGWEIIAAASAGGVALKAIGETNVPATIDAAGTGTLTLNGTATGAITFGPTTVNHTNVGVTVRSLISTTGFFGTSSNHSMTFMSNNSSALRINAGSPGNVEVLATTTSTSPATGALTVGGGLGIAKGVYIGESLSVASDVLIGAGFGGTALVVNKANQNITQNIAGSAMAHIAALTTDTMAINKGGTIGLGGNYIGTSNFILFGLIAGRKENGTDADSAGYLSFNTFQNGVGLGERMRISSTGVVTVNALATGDLTSVSGVITSSSDARLKDKEGDFIRSIGDLMKMDAPILYRWNRESGLSRDRVFAGWEAQGVAKGIPEAVSTGPNGMLGLSDRPILAATVNAVIEHEYHLTAHNKSIEQLTHELVTAQNEIVRAHREIAALRSSIH